MKFRDKTLGEAALNPDGKTYNGVRAVQWMFEAVTGKTLTDKEVEEVWAEAKRIAAAKNAARTSVFD